MQANGWDLSNLKYVQLEPETESQLLLKKGDLLFNRTNSKELVGKCDVFREDGKWVFASYLIRIRLDEGRVLPLFVSDFLNSSAGRVQIDRISRQIIGMSNVNAEELRDLLIPLPPLQVQRMLVDEMEAERNERQRKLAQADELLMGFDTWVLAQLRIVPPPIDSRRVFAVRLGDVDGALNPERYSGLRLERVITGVQVRDVGTILDSKISPSKADAGELWDRIRIDDLPNNPLEVERVQSELGSQIDGSFFLVQENDVLLARLGPTIQNTKFVLCPQTQRQTVASSEFLVLRCHSGWLPEAVLAVLRTRLYRDLMYSKSRGATPSRYRLNAGDFANLPFPIISSDLQERIAHEAKRRRNEVRRLRNDVEAEWQAAKRRFEAKLLTGEVA